MSASYSRLYEEVEGEISQRDRSLSPEISGIWLDQSTAHTQVLFTARHAVLYSERIESKPSRSLVRQRPVETTQECQGHGPV